MELKFYCNGKKYIKNQLYIREMMVVVKLALLGITITGVGMTQLSLLVIGTRVHKSLNI